MIRVLRGGLTAALVALFLFSSVASASAVDWTDFGGTPKRQHRAEERATLPVSLENRFWVWDIGVSCSQPLVVGDTLYVLAAKGQTSTPPAAGLYAFDLRALDGWPADKPRQLEPLPGYPVQLNADPLNYEPSQGHVTYDPTTGGFFWGTADGRLAAWKPGMPEPAFQPMYKTRPGDIRIVSAPLVLSPDVVAVGTSEGGIAVVSGLLAWGLGKGGLPVVVGCWVPGAVTSSFVMVDKARFLIGIDGIGGHGEVRCYALTPGGLQVDTSWGNGGCIVTPAGVPASFAVDDPYFYFSDKFGTFYKAELGTGKVVWARRFETIPVHDWLVERVRMADPSGNPFPVWVPDLPDLYSLGPDVVSVAGSKLFVNHSPAVGEDFVYWTVRTSDRTSPRGSAGWAAPGLLIALSKDDGSLRWAVKLPGNGNTCPLVWPYARRVLVGCRDYEETKAVRLSGWITCWDSDTGRPRLLLQDGNWAWWGIPLGEFWWQVAPGSPSWSQLSGPGVEITLTRGVLVVGGGFVDTTSTTGNLQILRLPDPVNLRLAGASRDPSGAVGPGKEVMVRATVELAQGGVPVDTWVGWRWKGESEWRKVQDVTLSPEAREVTVSFRVTAPQATRALEVKVNPDELHPATETDYRDNSAEVLVEVKEPPPPLDLALAMVYPKELWVGMVVKVWVDAWTAQGLGATTDVVFTVNGQRVSKRVTLPAGRPGAVVRSEFGIEAFSPGTLRLEAVVNPKRNPSEIRYDNNRYAVDVPVYGWGPSPGGEVRVWLIR